MVDAKLFHYKKSDFIPIVGLNSYIDRIGSENISHPKARTLAGYHGLMIYGMVFVEPVVRSMYSGVVNGLEILLK